MPSPFDKAPPGDLAAWFAGDDVPADTIVAHWNEALTTSGPGATIRLESAATGDESSLAVPVRNVGRAGEPGLDYEVGALIGKGGGGRVFEAKQVSAKRTVALKRMPADDAGFPSKRFRFLQEALLAAEFDHPHLLAVYDVGKDRKGQPFFTMPRVEGIPWSRTIRERSRADNLAILAKVADAVAHLHVRGVVHRDVKPGNVLLGPHGEVLLMDWGLAARLPVPGKGRGLPLGAASGGTPAYMSPEMARDDRTLIGYASDVYLLGAVLYEILTGKPPHYTKTTAESLAHAARAAPPGLRSLSGSLGRLARQCLQHDPARRPSLDEFRRVVSGGGRTSLSFGSMGLIALALILSTAGIVYYARHPAEQDSPRDEISPEERAALQMSLIHADIGAQVPDYTQNAIIRPENGEVVEITLPEMPALSSLEFLRHCSNLRTLIANGCGIASLEPLRGKPMRHLQITRNKVDDLSPLAGMPLELLDIGDNPVSSLEPLRGMALRVLQLGGTRVTDLSPLSGVPLEELDLGGTPASPTPKGMMLTTSGPQVRWQYGRLPFRRAPVADLTPLAGAPLRFLRCDGINPDDDNVRKNGAHHAGQPLDSLAFLSGNNTLVELSVAYNAITDLSSLVDAPLIDLDLRHNRVRDLSPLRGKKLLYLYFDGNQVETLAPLEGMPIRNMFCRDNPITDFSALLTLSHLGEAELQADIPKDFHPAMRAYMESNDALIRALPKVEHPNFYFTRNLYY